MQYNNFTRLMSAVALITLGACDKCDNLDNFDVPSSEIDCADAANDDIDVSVNQTRQGKDASTIELTSSQDLGSDLHIHGTAHQLRDLAIRRLTVGGIEATTTKVNYATWDATIPFEALGEPEDGTSFALPVEASDACGTTASLSLVVHFEALVGSLAARLTSGALPASGSRSTILTISADAASVGASVSVTAPQELLLGGLVDGQVLLQKTDVGASAQLTLSADETKSPTGLYTIKVASHGLSDTTQVRILAAPKFFPDQETLAPGETLHVLVQKDGDKDDGGDIKACQATPSDGLTVTASGVDISVSPAAPANADGDVDLTIKADATSTDEATVTISCVDEFGQFGFASFDLLP